MAAALMVLATSLALAQSQGSKRPASSSHTSFGQECRIGNTDPASAEQLTRAAAGGWMVLGGERRASAGDTMTAHVWHESNWMVDLHDSPGAASPVVHSGQLCFDGQGKIKLLIDRYMELAPCRCLRFTSLVFAPDGRVTRREQNWVDALSETAIKPPAAAGDFPPVWEYRKLEQLPFFPLLKK